MNRQHHEGDLGGRGPHPIDPGGRYFGMKHWPLPQAHEQGAKLPRDKKSDEALLKLIVEDDAESKKVKTGPLELAD